MIKLLKKLNLTRANLALTLATVFLVVFGTLAVLFAQKMLRDMERIASVATDNVPWTLARGQVDFLRLGQAVHLAQDGGSLGDLRSAFEAYSSRIGSFQDNSALTMLPDADAVAELLKRVQIRLDYMLPLFQGPDQGLYHALPDITRVLNENLSDMEFLSATGQSSILSDDSIDLKGMVVTVHGIGTLVIVLVSSLGLAALMLGRLLRRSQELAEANKAGAARQKAILTCSLDAIMMVDDRLRVVSFNEVAEKIFGFTREEAIGMYLVDVVVPDHLRQFCIDNFESFLDTGQGQLVGRGRMQLEAKRKSGDLFPVEFNISASKAGQKSVFVIFLRDISDLVAAEAELRQARDSALAGERAKSNLLTVMSHEIRTPLNGILGSIELLETTGMVDEEARYLQAMRISGELLLHHVNEVLELSRLESGVSAEQIQAFNLEEMVTGMVDGQRASALRRGNCISLQCRMLGEPLVLGCIERTQQALLNLVGNALKFTHKGEVSVEIERHRGSDTVEFRVCDTGQGISETDLARVFDDFVTLDTSYGRLREGTGLGLAITRRIVENLGGEISVESELGEGSMFTFSLPLPVVAELPDAQAAIIHDMVTSKRLLVVEDNAINLMLLEKMLQRQGHYVDSATGGAEGVEAVANNQYDLVFMDISMPEVDGITALGQIKDRNLAEGVVIVALTAHAATEDRDRILRSGFDEVLTKPVSQASLADLIYRHLGEADEEDTGPEDSDIQQLVTALGEERAQGYLNAFCQDVAQLLQTLDTSERVDQSHKNEAHRLAGSAAVLGLSALRRCMLDIEEATPDVEPNLASLAEAWTQAGPILEPHLSVSQA